MLNEQALTFGKEIRPLFGHVVVLAGGAGVGKGAVVDNLIDFPKAKYLNPDSLKKYVSYADDISLKSSKTLVAMARVKSSKKFRQHLIDHMEEMLRKNNPHWSDEKVEEKTIRYTKALESTIDMSNRELVAELHFMFKDIDMESNILKTFAKSQTNVERLPNVIIDGTLKNLHKVESQLNHLVEVGYKPENIHLVWVVNSNENSKVNNAMRRRSVPESTRLETLEKSTRNIVNMLKNREAIVDVIRGNWYVVFSEFNMATKETTIENPAKSRRTIFADYVMVKKPNRAPSLESIDKKTLERIGRNLKWAEFDK